MYLQPPPKRGPRLNGAGKLAPSAPPDRPSSPAGAASVSADSRSRGVNTALPAPGSSSSSRRPGRPTCSRGTRLRLGPSGRGKRCGPAVRVAGRTFPLGAQPRSATQPLQEHRPPTRCRQYMCPAQSVRRPAPGVVWAPRKG
ncbi:hypothetical protein NDU88_002108 [Pleurodeles waltl]|uniref:Uncharacterized protein n=1 Tax=Pleurodeles waltl TaxID=8319 RepID=A0AAV7S9B7_PLEWA|nr:hypothetical protein NDU88_002108 [Pleurodeles waltl]